MEGKYLSKILIPKLRPISLTFRSIRDNISKNYHREKNMKNFFISIGFLCYLALPPAISSQTQIDVYQMRISLPDGGFPIRFDLMAFDQSALPVNFTVFDSNIIEVVPSYVRCYPCKSPQLLETNVFTNPMSTPINSQSSTVIRIHHTSLQMNPVHLSRLFHRKSDFVISGPTRLQGRLEIIDLGAPGGRLLYFDNDVVLEGRYSMQFQNPFFFAGQRLTKVTGMVYDFAKPK